MIYKTLHRKLKIEQQEPHKKPRENSGTAKGYIISSNIFFFLIVLSENMIIFFRLLMLGMHLRSYVIWMKKTT